MDILVSTFELLHPSIFVWVLIGTTLGIVVGAIPGLSGAMLIALSLPLTFYMESADALVLLVSMYVGAITGGLIAATMFAIPGTGSAVVTTFDGPPMVAKGQAGQALALGVMASFVGGVVSWIFLAVIARPMARLALQFGPFDYFALVMVALVLMASVSRGSMLKGLFAGFFGMLVAMPGLDPTSAQLRFDFGISQMVGGFRTLPVLIGVFAIAVVMEGIVSGTSPTGGMASAVGRIRFKFADIRRHWSGLLRSSVIGTWIGILPGVGGSVASIVSYTVAKNVSRHPEKFGEGAEEGIVASEAANNSSICGALIPLVAMGIPGSVVDAVLLGALMIHNLQPGPLLFQTNPDVVNAIIGSALVAHVLMLIVMLTVTGLIARVALVPKGLIYPAILIFCMVGTYASGNRMFDVWVMLGFGLLGLLMQFCKVPPGPFVIGFILAPIAETNLRSGLMATGGDWIPIFTRPLSAGMMLVALVLLFAPLISKTRGLRQLRGSQFY